MSRNVTVIFWALFAAAFIVGTIMPGCLIVRHGWARGSRWIQNYLSTTLYLLAFFPAAVGVLGATYVDHPHLLPRGMAGALSSGLLAVLLLVAVFVTWRDFVTLDAIPFLLNDGEGQAGRVWALEPKLRDGEGTLYDSPECAEYTQLVQPFGSWAGLRRRANWLAVPLFFVNAVGAVCVAFLGFGLALASKLGPTGFDAEAAKQLTAVFVLLLLWFPLRVYTNWYQFAPYRPTTLNRQRLLLALVIVALLVAFLSWHSFQPGLSRNVLFALVSTVTAAVLAAAKAPWPVFRKVATAVANTFQSADFSYFLMIAIGLLVVSGVVATDFVPVTEGTRPSVEQAEMPAPTPP